jgi:hypothetical protein
MKRWALLTVAIYLLMLAVLALPALMLAFPRSSIAEFANAYTEASRANASGFTIAPQPDTLSLLR